MVATRVGNGWPHVVLHREPHNERYEIKVGNIMRPELVRPAAFAYFQTGAVDRDGMLTPAGRELVREGVRVQARQLGALSCIVWGPRSCTWLGIRDVEGDDPPFGEPGDTGDWRHLPVVTVPGAWIELHHACAASHVFLRRLAHDRVEVSSAAPMIVGWWNERPRSDESDPFEGFRAENGTFRAPKRFRGVEVKARDDGALIGPVQPDGLRSILTAPWPDLVRDACAEIAGRSISVALLDAAWRAVADDQSHRVTTEVRRAA